MRAIMAAENFQKWQQHCVLSHTLLIQLCGLAISALHWMESVCSVSHSEQSEYGLHDCRVAISSSIFLLKIL